MYQMQPPQPPKPPKKKLNLLQIVILLAAFGFAIWYLYTALAPAASPYATITARAIRCICPATSGGFRRSRARRSNMTSPRSREATICTGRSRFSRMRCGERRILRERTGPFTW